MRNTPKSSITGKEVSDEYLQANDIFFRDVHGRAVLLRGVNFSGSSKAPVGQPSQTLENFWEDAESGKVSFIGRPLDLEDGSADVHLARLRAWGFNMLRFVFTWESIEHEGPGKYDVEYMDYLIKVLYKIKEYGFKVYMDPHQDVWSRFSGGSGAPIWTLYAAGIDPRNITKTFASLVHCEYPTPDDPQPSTFPGMIWGTNYTRLVCQTMFTLFYAGKTYAPKCIIDRLNIQDWLQNHFLGAVAALAKRIVGAPGLLDDCIIGWDSMNEPGEGLIGHEDLSQLKKDLQLKKGPMPTPWQSMKLSMGQEVAVDNWSFSALGPARAGQVILNPNGTKLWLQPEEEETRGGGKWGWKRDKDWKLGTCIWALHGIWDAESGALLKPRYFDTIPGKTVRPDFTIDFFTPHWIAYGTRIRSLHPDAILFVNDAVFHPPPIVPQDFLKGRAVNSAHFYDGLTLMTKHWNWFNADALGLIRGKYWNIVQGVRIGDKAIRDTFQYDLGLFKQDTEDTLGKHPTIMGEIGIPYDMDEKRAYGYVEGGRGKGDYSSQQKAMDASLNGADGPNCINYTLWTYCPDNTHQWGDGWNGEDLSIWSPDDVNDDDDTESLSGSSALLSKDLTQEAVAAGRISPSLLMDGARAIGAFCRPFPVKTAGTPVHISFDIRSTTFKFIVRVEPDTDVDSGTEIYLPYVHYATALHPKSIYRGSAASSRVSLLDKKQESLSSASQSRTSTPTSDNIALDITVSASKGRYDTQGQYLTWYYPAPTTIAETYTIEIKRKGGALFRQQEVVQGGGWGEHISQITYHILAEQAAYVVDPAASSWR